MCSQVHLMHTFCKSNFCPQKFNISCSRGLKRFAKQRKAPEKNPSKSIKTIAQRG
jgi:hypothetical protein